jgi:phage tail sheath protein FI
MVLTSPGIAYREVDATVYPVTIDSSIVGIVGFTDKGPENKATLITSPEQLIKTFGEPNENLYGQGLLAALEILETTNRLYFVRAASGTVPATANVPFVTCPFVRINTTYQSKIGTDKTLKPIYIRAKLVGENSEVLADRIYSIPSPSSGVYEEPIKALEAVFGDGTAKGDVIGVAADNENQLYIYGAYGGPNYYLETSASYAANDALTSLSGISGISDFYFTSSLGISGLADAGATSAVSGYGLEFVSGAIRYGISSLYGGPGYNYGRSIRTGEVTGISVDVDNIIGPWFNIYVNEKGYVNENFRTSFYGDNTFITEIIKSSETDTPLRSDFIKADFAGSALSGSFTVTPLTSPANKITNLFVGEVASGFQILDDGSSPVDLTGKYIWGRFAKLKQGNYKLLNGSNGSVGDITLTGVTDEAAALIGDKATKTGMYALDDDNLNISMAIIPGCHQARVQNELITLAETSQNFIAAISPPAGFNTAQKAVDWINGKDSLGDRKAPINSSYVAVYWPHVQIFNTYTQRDIWMDPAVYGIRAMAFTDSVAAPWFAPAGFNRGRLTKPLDTEEILSQGDRDALYENNINPMVKFFPEGITIFGQKTAKRLPSATDRINVRRLMIFIRKNLLRSTRAFVFEPNDPLTWDGVKTSVEGLLRDIASRRGIAESRVVCDSTVNTPLRVSRREMWCKIIIRPVEAAEYIIFEVNLTNNTSNVGA